MKRILLALMLWCLPSYGIEVYLVRHGQTDWNAQRLLQGKTDIPLNNEGRRQAEELAKTLSGVNFAACYSSDLSRTQETASILLKNKNVAIVTDSRWRERNCGKWEGFPLSEYENASPAEKDDVESTTSLVARAREALSEIHARHEKDKVLIVSHGGLIKVLLKDLLKKSRISTPSNACYIKLVNTRGTWKLNKIQEIRVRR